MSLHVGTCCTSSDCDLQPKAASTGTRSRSRQILAHIRRQTDRIWLWQSGVWRRLCIPKHPNIALKAIWKSTRAQRRRQWVCIIEYSASHIGSLCNNRANLVNNSHCRLGREWFGLHQSHHGQWEGELRWKRGADTGWGRRRHPCRGGQTKAKDDHHVGDILDGFWNLTGSCYCSLE